MRARSRSRRTPLQPQHWWNVPGRDRAWIGTLSCLNRHTTIPIRVTSAVSVPCVVPLRWKRAAEIAAGQYGVISCTQLLAGGFTRRRIDLAVTGGHLIPIHRGVYGLGHPPTDMRGNRVAATLATGEGSWISNRSGAEHVRILPRRNGAIHLTVPTRAGRRPGQGLIVHRSKLAPDERRTIERVRCTSVSRVLLDLAGGNPGELEGAIKAAGNRELLSVGTCMKLLDRYPRRPGSSLLRRLLLGEEPVPTFTRSGLERRMFRLCRTSGLPLPQTNVDIPTEIDVHECDCVWPEYRLIVECDSRWHDNPIASVDDARKDQDLTLAGWRVHRLRWAQIVLAPELAARTIRHLLNEQARLLGLGA